MVPAAGWQQITCGDGAKGPRFYDWALIAAASPAHHLLVRRPVSGGELAFFTCHARPGTPLSELVAVAGARWAIEEHSRPPRTRPAWTTTRSAATTPACSRHLVHAGPGVPDGRRSPKGAPAPVDNFPRQASSMILTTLRGQLASSR